MENATKALLIAAAILITIVIIAIGVLLLGNSSDVSEQADKVGTSLSTSAEEAVIGMQGGVYLSKEKLLELLRNIGYETHYTTNEGKFADNVFVRGYLFKGYVIKEGEKYSWYNERGEKVIHQEGKDLIETWIPEMLDSGQIKIIKNPGKSDSVLGECKKYRDSIQVFKEKWEEYKKQADVDYPTVRPFGRFSFLDNDYNQGKDSITNVVYLYGIEWQDTKNPPRISN